MRYAREFDGVHRGQALAAILIELPAQVLSNFEFDDATQVASFDADDNLVNDFDGAEVDVIEVDVNLDELEAELEAELEQIAPPVNDAAPSAWRFMWPFPSLFKRKRDR